jgi:hypothetical protein
MNGRSSRLQTFLSLFAGLKATTGNKPNAMTPFDQTTEEVRAAATRLDGFLAESNIESEIFHGADKMVAHVPEQFENAWKEFKRVWEPRLNYLVMCDIDPDWPRDYEEHLKIYEQSDVIPDARDDKFIPEFHDGPAAIRQALDYLQDHDECRAGLAALKYLVDTVGLDLVAIMERWQKVPLVFMPKHLAPLQQMSPSGPLTELFDDAVRAYVCGSPAAAFAMCRALLETVLKQSYFLPGELIEQDQSGWKRDIPLKRLLDRAGRRYSFIPSVKLKDLVDIANKILHSSTAPYDESDILDFFKILKNLIQRAPAPR